MDPPNIDKRLAPAHAVLEAVALSIVIWCAQSKSEREFSAEFGPMDGEGLATKKSRFTEQQIAFALQQAEGA
jgi:hypothetical protein